MGSGQATPWKGTEWRSLSAAKSSHGAALCHALSHALGADWRRSPSSPPVRPVAFLALGAAGLPRPRCGRRCLPHWTLTRPRHPPCGPSVRPRCCGRSAARDSAARAARLASAGAPSHVASASRAARLQTPAARLQTPAARLQTSARARPARGGMRVAQPASGASCGRMPSACVDGRHCTRAGARLLYVRRVPDPPGSGSG